MMLPRPQTLTRLSRTSSIRRSPMTVHSASSAERPWASAMSSEMLTVGSTSAASVTEASETRGTVARPQRSSRLPLIQIPHFQANARRSKWSAVG